MAFPRTPGGLFPLTTAPTGRNAGGQYPLPAVLSDAIRSLAPTAYWKLDEASGNLADTMSGGYTATVTGSPTYGAARPPIGRGVTWSGTGMYASTSGSATVPTTSMSVLGFFRTTDATAANRYIAGRAAANQHSWGLRLTSGHVGSFFVAQSGGAAHASQATTGAVNDGLWHLIGGTFDGTTLRVYRDLVTNSTASLTGTWHTASTAPIQIAAYNTTTLWIGDLGPCAYFANKVLTASDFRYLYSIAFGG